MIFFFFSVLFKPVCNCTMCWASLWDVWLDTSGVTDIFLTSAQSEENRNALWETSVDVLCLGQSSNTELSKWNYPSVSCTPILLSLALPTTARVTCLCPSSSLPFLSHVCITYYIESFKDFPFILKTPPPPHFCLRSAIFFINVLDIYLWKLLAAWVVKAFVLYVFWRTFVLYIITTPSSSPPPPPSFLLSCYLLLSPLFVLYVFWRTSVLYVTTTLLPLLPPPPPPTVRTSLILTFLLSSSFSHFSSSSIFVTFFSQAAMQNEYFGRKLFVLFVMRLCHL